MTLELEDDRIKRLVAEVASATADAVIARLFENKEGRCMGPQAAKLLGVSVSRLRQLARIYPDIKERKGGRYYDVKKVMLLKELRDAKAQ